MPGRQDFRPINGRPVSREGGNLKLPDMSWEDAE